MAERSERRVQSVAFAACWLATATVYWFGVWMVGEAEAGRWALGFLVGWFLVGRTIHGLKRGS